jgi:hypothetical protein
MKRLFLLSILFIAASFSHPLKEGSMTPEERKFAVDYFNKTKERLLKDIKGLSPEQLNFRADTAHWSVSQCVEHIALAENMIWQFCMMGLKQPADPEKASEDKFTTEKLISLVLDRSTKFKAPDMLQPGKKFQSFDESVHAYLSRRDSTIAYLASTQDLLKDHYINHPAFGVINLYHAVIFVAAHSERHTEQVEEVMANPAFPKK